MNILLNLIMLGICLILIVLGMIYARIRKDIIQNVDILAENQQKLSRQIARNNEHKESSKWLSSYERGRIERYQGTYGIDHFLSFHTQKQRDLFLEENEDLVKDYLMI